MNASQARNTKLCGLRIGILGGGQLARMLALRGHELGFEMHVLSENSTDPAAQVVRHWHKGSPSQKNSLRKFFNSVDGVTFESEFYSGKLLNEISKETGIPLSPSPTLMSQFQDRLHQKNLLEEFEIPTARFLSVETPEEFEEACVYFNHQVVFKKREGGYDGNGTFVLSSRKNKSEIFEKLSLDETPAIGEELVKFRRELASGFARDQKGNIAELPLVESFQKDSRCFWVQGPIHHPQWKELKLQLKSMMSALDYVGILHFELFDTGKELLVNETAPRVHNSSHYSMNALSQDQFTLHLLAVAGGILKESPAVLTKNFAMVNLLGTHKNPPSWPRDLQGHLHWYGKLENRPGRKMGHLNFLSSSSVPILNQALKEAKRIKI